MALEPGTRLGSYQIVSALGAGGMGEVYRAHDTALGRDVAIKMLPEHFAADAERVGRFEREARVLAVLNHPNIAAIFGLERTGTGTALVMELAEGEPLAARIARGRVPPDEAIAIAVQIAAALAVAHDKGIVHRDLKPANIVLSPNGRVKVLDFGLAKLAGADNGNESFSAANSPTIAASMVGTILGTAAYMSPEQARGKAVDKRADIWAFGCVLFEMLAGRPAFRGETITDIVAAVVTTEPDWSALPDTASVPLQRTVRRCLTKDPDARLHDIADARIEITDASSAGPESVVRPARRPRWTTPLIAAAAAAVAAMFTWFIDRSEGRTEPTPTVKRLEVDLPVDVDLYAGNAPGVIVSPDDRNIAFVGVHDGGRHLYLRRFDSFEATALKGTEQVQAFFFSPDGASIGFITPDRVLKRISLSDGLVVPVARDADQYSFAEWGADDRITFNRDGPLVRIAARGGAVSPLTTLNAEKHELLHSWPYFLPGGHALLLETLSGDDVKTRRIEAHVLSTGQRKEIVAGASPRYVATGHLVFQRERDLLAVLFNVDRLEITGPAVRVVENVGLDFNGEALASVSPSGTLAYVPGGGGTSRLVWVSRDGTEQTITSSAFRYQSPRLDPDGARIAVNMGGSLWIHDIARGSLTKLATDDAVGSGFTTWDPKGRRVAFRSRTGMRSVDVDSAQRSQPFAGSTGVRDIPTAIAPDGDTITFTRQDGETSGDVWVGSLSGRFEPRAVVRTPAYEGGGQFSPDGRWIAYASNESGRFQVYLRPFDESQRRIMVSSDGGSYPLWRRDGRELFYRSGNRMMAVEVAAVGSDLRLSAPRVLFDRRYGFETSTIANYDISPDGSRFLMVKDDVGVSRINVVLNWFEELKRLSPVRP